MNLFLLAIFWFIAGYSYRGMEHRRKARKFSKESMTHINKVIAICIDDLRTDRERQSHRLALRALLANGFISEQEYVDKLVMIGPSRAPSQTSNAL